MMKAEDRARWFRPPRPHGHVEEDRSVSFIELFYDLVFVLLIAQIAHTLADHVTWTGVRDFVGVCGLIWIAWVNGTLYHDLHGGDDGRSRTYIFTQMSLLVLLAVFTGHAADDATDGRGFAIVYTLLLLFIAWQWFDVRRFDTPEWRRVAGRYVAGMMMIAVIVLASIFVDNPTTRVWF
ncbi:MAG: low temperature requirement protein A, partial [Acidimicrobiia bacterium]|nr:low temperature requirement protein A [Acidimicrobiia bacterium]